MSVSSGSAGPGRGVLDLRTALGSEWSLNLPHWAMTFVPSLLLVAIQEVAVGTSDGSVILLSGVVQHLLAGVVGVPIAMVLARRGVTLPVWGTFLVSGVIGVGRGVLGGLLVQASGESAHYVFRVLFWLAVSWVWMSLTAYLLAQIAHRRLLLGDLEAVRWRRETVLGRRQRSGEEVRSQAVWAISASVVPVVDDIQRSLRSLDVGDAAELQQIGGRLADVAGHVSSTVDRLSVGEVSARREPPSSEQPLSSVLVFELTHPALWSALSALALLAVLVPITLDAEPDLLTIETVIAVLAAAVVLASVSGAARLRPGLRGIPPIVVRYLVAGLTGSLVLLALAGRGITPFGLLMVVVVPLGLIYSAAVISGAVGITVANRALVASITRFGEECDALDAAATEDERRVRAQLDALLHGPIQGRLAACAMALNFHSVDDGPAGALRTRQMADAVLAHLGAVVADLEALERSA